MTQLKKSPKKGQMLASFTLEEVACLAIWVDLKSDGLDVAILYLVSETMRFTAAFQLHLHHYGVGTFLFLSVGLLVIYCTIIRSRSGNSLGFVLPALY